MPSLNTVDICGYLHYTNLMIAKLKSHANVTLVAYFRYLYGLFREIFMKTDMNIIALEITSTTLLLPVGIQFAHSIDARRSSQAGMGQERVADNLQSSVEVNGCGYTPTPVYVLIGCC